MGDVKTIRRLLGKCTQSERKQIFDVLRAEFPIHALEADLGITAEMILEAIARSSDLVLRGIRGIIAEVAFRINVIDKLEGWHSRELVGDFSYDFDLYDNIGSVRVQVKMQRLKGHVPMLASQGYSWLPSDMYAVETQRTRGGKDTKTGEDTRPYRFGEFDILAVSMHPSTRDWGIFMYTVADWLLPRPEDAQLMLKFQPVGKIPDDRWTANLEEAIAWFRSKERKSMLRS